MTDRRLKDEGGTISGVAMVAGVPNANGLIYPPEVAKKLAEEMTKSRFLFADMKDGRFVTVPRAQLRLAAGEVSEATFDPETGRVTVQARILDTPSGQLVKQAMKGQRALEEIGLKPSQPLAMSVSAMGTLDGDMVVEAEAPVLSIVEAGDIEPSGER